MYIATVATRAAGRRRCGHPCGGHVGWRLLGGDGVGRDEVSEEGDEGEGCRFLHLAEDGRQSRWRSQYRECLGVVFGRKEPMCAMAVATRSLHALGHVAIHRGAR